MCSLEGSKTWSKLHDLAARHEAMGEKEAAKLADMEAKAAEAEEKHHANSSSKKAAAAAKKASKATEKQLARAKCMKDTPLELKGFVKSVTLKGGKMHGKARPTTVLEDHCFHVSAIIEHMQGEICRGTLPTEHTNMLWIMMFTMLYRFVFEGKITHSGKVIRKCPGRCHVNNNQQNSEFRLTRFLA